MLQIHVAVSLIGILAGLLVLYGLLSTRLSSQWCAIFLAATILTSLSGFPLAPFGFDPPRAVGVISLILLAVAVAAYYAFHLSGAWRWIFVDSAIAALYLNVFVLIVQSFTKLPFLKALAPTQSEPPLVAPRPRRCWLSSRSAFGLFAGSARSLRRGRKRAALAARSEFGGARRRPCGCALFRNREAHKSVHEVDDAGGRQQRITAMTMRRRRFLSAIIASKANQIRDRGFVWIASLPLATKTVGAGST